MIHRSKGIEKILFKNAIRFWSTSHIKFFFYLNDYYSIWTSIIYFAHNLHSLYRPHWVSSENWHNCSWNLDLAVLLFYFLPFRFPVWSKSLKGWNNVKKLVLANFRKISKNEMYFWIGFSIPFERCINLYRTCHNKKS